MQSEALLEANPLREGLYTARTPEPNAMVIFGATGDLTRSRLVPALYNLFAERRLPTGFTVIGFARRPWSDEDFRTQMRRACERGCELGLAPGIWESFEESLSYVSSDFENPAGYQRLRELLEELDRRRGTAGNRVYYLATPPEDVPLIARRLGASGLAHPERRHDSPAGWVRLVVEKPFGEDLQSARALNHLLLEVFREDEIYRIDHYLGKETVQNILVLRFANGIYEPIWNRRYVDHVQITVAEAEGVETRGRFYDHTGALRDILQNHMMQLLSLVAMEPPTTFDADMVRGEKVKVLHSLRLPALHEVPQLTVRGQYGPGFISGEPVPGYREEPGVAPNSTTETYVALKLFVDNWRWADVPFYLRTGKRLTRRLTEIAVQFRRPPLRLFGPAMTEPTEGNVLVLRIQPDEGISLRFAVKQPGLQMEVRPVTMEFLYGTTFGRTSEAYERLLLDCMLGDSTLFIRSDEVEAAWAYATQILHGWQMEPPSVFPNYEAGTWGPLEAQELIAKDGRRWRRF